MHSTHIDITHQVAQLHLLCLSGPIIIHTHLPINPEEPKQLLYLPIISRSLSPEIKLTPSPHHNIERSTHQRNHKISLQLIPYHLMHNRLIRQIRNSAPGHTDIRQPDLTKHIPATTKTTLQNKHIANLCQLLRNRTLHHKHELLRRQRHRITHHLNIVLIMLRLHPRNIIIIRTPLNLTKRHKITPKRLKPHQHLRKNMLLQPMLRPQPATLVISRIQM